MNTVITSQPNLNIGIKLGGTNIIVGLLNNRGDPVCFSEEIAYKEILEKNGNAVYTRNDIYGLIFSELEKLLYKNHLTINNLLSQQRLNLYISFAGPIDNKTNLVFRPKSIPCMKNPFNLKKEISLYAKSFYNRRAVFLKNIRVFVLHDAASSVLGETGSKGTIPGEKDAMVFLSGTGVGAGFLKNGKLFYGKGINNLLGEIGYFLIFNDGKYEFIGYRIKGNLHIPMEYDTRKVFRHRFCTVNILIKYANLLLKSKDNQLRLLAREYLSSEYKTISSCKRIANVLTEEIKKNDKNATFFIKKVSNELGLALATFISHPKHKNEKFVYHIVFGGSLSSLSEIYSKKLQKGVKNALYVNLKNFDFEEKEAKLISVGFTISHLDAKRELLGLGKIINKT